MNANQIINMVIRKQEIRAARRAARDKNNG